jgi:predicted enzyme related to lactoylglutathione lyase
VKVLGIDNVFLEVGDLEEAIRFYRDALGLPVAKRFDAMGTILFQVGEETPGLGVSAVPAPRVGGQKVWFEVADARAAAAELEAGGNSLLAAPFPIPTGWVFEVADPWGNVIGFTDYQIMPQLGRPETSPPAATAGDSQGG